MQRPTVRQSNPPAHSFLERLQTLWSLGWLPCLILTTATFMAYQPVWQAGFVWDDDALLTELPGIAGPLGLKAVWTSSAAVYYPLALISFWVQHALWGLNPLPYHLVNIALHAACAILLWRVLGRLIPQSRTGAWLGAALWALHPVQVESVAWISELKNTQSCLFCLLAIGFFLRWRAGREPERRKGNEWNYALALLGSVLAILTEPSTLMLPMILGLCEWWLEGRWRWRNVLRLAPFLLISAAAGVWTVWEQQFHSGALGPAFSQTVAERFIVAAKDVWFYLGKLLWPHPLIFVYPRWAFDASRPAAYLPVQALAIGIGFLWTYRNGRLRPVFFAMACFLTALFPVLGFYDACFFRYSFVEDHLQYLASMGPLALAAAGIVAASGFFWKSKPFLKPALCGTLLLGLGVLTWRQCGMYADLETLWRTTIARNPACWVAYNNLGLIHEKMGRVDAAIADYQNALEILPNFADARFNLGNALLRNGQVDAAIADYRKALEIKPDFADALVNLGNALLQKGQVDAAIVHFQKALDVQPGNAEAHNNLGNALLNNGDLDGAISHYRSALEIQPANAMTHYNLGYAFFQEGRMDEAIVHFQKALEIRPGFAEACNSLGYAFFQKGRMDEAIGCFEKTLEIRPDYMDARVNLGNALLKAGRVHEAIAHYQSVLAIQPDSADACKNLAWVLATCPEASVRNGIEAVQLAQQANHLSGGSDPQIVGTLAAAYAEAGRFPEATASAQQAIQLATARTNTALINALQLQIISYQAGNPFRDTGQTNAQR